MRHCGSGRQPTDPPARNPTPGKPGRLDSVARPDRVRLVDAAYDGEWDLPVLGRVAAPAGVLVRPDGHVVWVDHGEARSPEVALARWFG